jgi:ectoine hydroxylase-related dioxygenase (phytanoyl-CoA dioxygenase family)
VRQFVLHGYELHRRRLPMAHLRWCRDFVLERLPKKDIHERSRAIMDELAKQPQYEALMRAPLDLMRGILGPDVCMLNYDALWINAPRDKDPVLLKGIHNDAWSGTGVNTVFAKVFLTDCDKWNGVTVYPESHLQGMLPVRNRKLAVKVRFRSVNIVAEAGDLLIWHPLLLHKTTGHSNRATRVSITARYTSTETAFTSQERALGYRTLSVGPLNTVLRLIGNDALTPLRTYGGKVAIDRRLAHLYGE